MIIPYWVSVMPIVVYKALKLSIQVDREFKVEASLKNPAGYPLKIQICFPPGVKESSNQ